MNSEAVGQASHCIENLLQNATPPEFGLKVQALAAHVLLRLGCRVIEINRTGHPDIVAMRDGYELRLEVEAEVLGSRGRQPTADDLAALINGSTAIGYFALAVSRPTPHWIVVPAEKLVGRRPSHKVLLKALSDRELSDAWTDAYVELLSEKAGRVVHYSFETLCRRALAGRGL